jgi:hypothetical protein
MTITDADSWASKVYFDQVEDCIRINYETDIFTFVTPHQVYSRNRTTTIITLTHDDMYSGIDFFNFLRL